MVYAFTLPTTSHLSFQTFLSSSTHPSLPQAATTARHAFRQALKTHKRLPRGPQQDAHLSTILTTLTNYLPYLEAISNGLSSKPTDATSEEIEITLHSEIVTFWRPTLTTPPSTTLTLKSRTTSHTSSTPNSSSSGNGGSKFLNTSGNRLRGEGIDFEIAFVLTTLGYVLSLLAHTGLMRTLYASTTPTAEQRTTAAQTATKYLLQASAIHNLLASSPSFATAARTSSLASSIPQQAPTSSTATKTTAPPTLPDLDSGTQTALSALALAEATLLAVLKDDSYVFACIQARNPKDKDWMVRAPEIPKVRAHLFARLCIRAAEYAEQAAAGLGSVVGKTGKTGAIEEELLGYTRVLGRVARARACRFFGVDAELAGKIGEGIAWLQAAKGALGVRSRGGGGGQDKTDEKEGSKSKFSKFKQGFKEKLEEKKMEKDAGTYGGHDKKELGPGDNAGREEEGRVIEMLEGKWVRMNNTVRIPSCFPALGIVMRLMLMSCAD
ncbi:pH-signaling protein PalC [Aspergillus homomorphus CBS 101889]|uniref:pH-response regulator protein palC n=1 Tax=Aspergillus homomorphus (strain CBS 101889) TaxID=1450537 RepID=A0A395HZX0_ASPHC|nr:hypothetical protein BO97DRAFT_404940 [Aspergillus homomorphus CBS 101889]RAL13492.1 hypothetical protein BO97DRAFT_404940 [Aspergillus homomorphus CBS 101889]